MILVTGATGNVGNALVHALAARDEAVRGLARNLDRARFPSTVDVVSADLETPEGVVPTLGPQPLTPSEQVGTLARLLARPLRYEPMTDQEARSEMEADTPASIIDAFFRFFTGGEFDDAGVVELRPGDHGPPSPHIRAVGLRPRPRLHGRPMTGDGAADQRPASIRRNGWPQTLEPEATAADRARTSSSCTDWSMT